MTSKLTTFAILCAAGAISAGSFFLSGNRAGSGGVADARTHTSEPQLSSLSPSNIIQVAILLDTSSSMNGLINQTRTEIWGLVNDLAETKRNGQPPQVEIALYQYGSPELGSETGFVKKLSPLTSDLDAISESLFSLTTNGGSEYPGHAILNATTNLDWDDDDSSLKMIFIAGNESFSQGPTAYQSAISEAEEKGIIVNTIYCGVASSHDFREWQNGAVLAKGKSMNIDQSAIVRHVASPHDEEIARLSTQLNSTYMAFGALGKRRAALQSQQDANAGRDIRSTIGRAKSKVSTVYRNSSWDLVDAVADGASIEDMNEEELPESIKGLSKTERQQAVKKAAASRSEIATQLKELTAKRDDYVAKATKNSPKSAAPTLKEGLLQVAAEQAEAKGFTKK